MITFSDLTIHYDDIVSESMFLLCTNFGASYSYNTQGSVEDIGFFTWKQIAYLS